MIARVVMLDDSIFLINTEAMEWAQVVEVMPSPETCASGLSEGKPEIEIVEKGKLIPQGFLDDYTLEGRTAQSPAPAAGFCTVSFFFNIMKRHLSIVADANVPLIKTWTMEPIDAVQCVVLPRSQDQYAAILAASGQPLPEAAPEPSAESAEALNKVIEEVAAGVIDNSLDLTDKQIIDELEAGGEA